MRVIIAGTRTFTDMKRFCKIMKGVRYGLKITSVVSGGCQGVDQMGARWARNRKIPVKTFPYLKKYGKAGGPMRNTQMAKYADALVLFWDGKSTGSLDMLTQAKRHCLSIYVYRY